MAPETTPKTKTSIYHYAVGRRKTAVARIRLFPKGKGDFEINAKSVDDFFSDKSQSEKAFAPLRLLEKKNSFDFTIKVQGGGINAQAEAIRHGISRALVEMDPDLRPDLKKAGFLRRDPRSVERKKPGLRKARRAPQFSKR